MNEEKKIKTLVFARRIVLVAVIVYIAVFFVWEFSSLSVDGIRRSFFDIKQALSGEGSPGSVVFSEDENGVSEVYADGIVRVTQTSATVYSKEGNRYSSFKISLVSPAVRTGKSKFLLFDRGGRNVYLCNSFGVISRYESQDNVINAGISESGKVFIIKEKYGYKAELVVFNGDLDENDCFIWDSAEAYLTDAAFADKNTLTVTGIVPTSDSFNTVVYRIDVKNGKKLSSFVFEDQTAVSVFSRGAGDATVLTTSSVIRVGEDDTRAVYSFDGLGVDVFDQNGRYIVLACVARVSTQTDEIVFIDADGNVRFTKEFVGVRDVAAVGDECYVLADGTVYAFDIYGNEKSKTDVPDAYGIRADNSAVFCVSAEKAVCIG